MSPFFLNSYPNRERMAQASGQREPSTKEEVSKAEDENKQIEAEAFAKANQPISNSDYLSKKEIVEAEARNKRFEAEAFIKANPINATNAAPNSEQLSKEEVVKAEDENKRVEAEAHKEASNK